MTCSFSLSRRRTRGRETGTAGRRPESGRWIVLTVGQQDPELPIELLAAVSEVPIP
jgi:hypothetical protein